MQEVKARISELNTSLQDLSPSSAKLCLKVIRFVERDLRLSLTDKSLLLAMSAGADSTAMFHIFSALAQKLNISLTVAHFDHALRPESADEASYVQDICQQRGINCVVKRFDVANYAQENALGIEDAGRICRYNFLEEVRAEYNCDYILTAHHLDDLTEDVLMRLTRGTSWTALAGMKAYDAKRKLVRPLLHCKKAALLAFLQELNITWFEDESNNCLDYKRNRIRHKLLPLIYEENPAFSDAVRNLWFLASIDDEYFQKQYKDYSSEIVESATELRLAVPVSEIRNLEKAIRLRLYADLIRKISGSHIRTFTLFAMDDFLINGHGIKKFQFPAKLEIQCSSKSLELIKQKN